MNNIAFFSYLTIGVGISGLGFSVFSRMDDGLPYVGYILNSDVPVKTVTALKKEIPSVINASEISSKYNDLPCAKKIFPSVSSWEVQEDEEENDSTQEDLNNAKGCFSVWWNNEEASENSNQKKTGNVLLSMSGEKGGIIFIAKVSVTGGIAQKVNEKLYFLEKKDGEEAWKVLSSQDSDEESVQELSLDKAGSDDLKNDKWTDSEDSGRLDWDLVSASATQGQREESSSEISDLSKWLEESSLFLQTIEKYESAGGYFRPS